MEIGHARVLVVDDSRAMRRVVLKILAGAGIAQVSEAADGLEALARLAEGPFDLVITDWQMPKLGGRELVSAMRGLPATRVLPVLVMSSLAGDEAFEAGADAVLEKPFAAPELLAWVRRLLPADGVHAVPATR